VTNSLCREPLDRLARFAFDWAPATCGSDSPCRDYHQSWSVIRHLQRGGALPAGAQEFAAAARQRLDAGGRPRVLISGAADTGILAMLTVGLGDDLRRCELFMIDRCRTPVLQNMLFAEAAGLSLTATATDVLACAYGNMDLIYGHNFLLFFDPEARAALFRKWASQLAPGGEICLMQSISKDGRGWQGTPPADISLKAAELSAAARAGGYSASESDALGVVVERLWSAMPVTHPLTESELQHLCAGAGLAVTSMVSLDEEFSSPLQVTAAAPNNRRIIMIGRGN